jgi:hypothetical protein
MDRAENLQFVICNWKASAARRLGFKLQITNYPLQMPYQCRPGEKIE